MSLALLDSWIQCLWKYLFIMRTKGCSFILYQVLKMAPKIHFLAKN